MHRRTLLSRVAAAAPALAGCLDAPAGGTTTGGTLGVEETGNAVLRVRLENAADGARELRLVVSHVRTAVCRFDEPACGVPDETDRLREERRTLQAGDAVAFDVDLPLTERVDTYRVEAAAGDGAHRTVEGVEAGARGVVGAAAFEAYDWRVGGESDLAVRALDGDLSVAVG